MEQVIAAAGRVFSNFGMIAITDIIDIAIMAFLIYKFIELIRSTNSGKVAKGIIFVLLALAVSGVCHLYTVNWLLNRAVEVGVLALVILFQPELRKLLERKGLFRGAAHGLR